MSIRFSLIMALALAATANAQQAVAADKERERLLIQNTRRLDVRLSLDKSRYFPRESAVLTITITNPTGVAMEVDDLLGPGTSLQDLEYQADYAMPRFARSTVGRRIGANETRTYVFSLDSTDCELKGIAHWHWTEASLNIFGNPDGRNFSRKAYSRVFHFVLDGQSWICATARSTTQSLEEDRIAGRPA